MKGTQESDVGNEFLYTGRRLDPRTGLYYSRYRYYHAQLGRFVNRDPIGYRGGVNLYGYVGGKPTRFVDPLGLCEEVIPGVFRECNGEGGFSGKCFKWVKGRKVYVTCPNPSNEGKGSGTFTHMINKVTFTVCSCGKTAEELQTAIYNDLQTFEHFNAGLNNIATVQLDSYDTGNYAGFNALGHGGFASDVINLDLAPVQLEFYDELSMVVGITLEGHMLEGTRWWYVRVEPSGFGCYQVEIVTEAWGRKVGLLNRVAGALDDAGPLYHAYIWDYYLLNIANAYNGDVHTAWWVPWDDGAYHSEEDTGQTVRPPGLPGGPDFVIPALP